MQYEISRWPPPHEKFNVESYAIWKKPSHAKLQIQL